MKATKLGGTTPVSVVWVELDEDRPRGHGVEFRHRGSRRTVVAFADGYDWLHKPGTPARVEILKRRPHGLSSEQWKEIVAQTKVAVAGFFNGSRKLGPNFDDGPVSAWYNG
jgi:hypothetical protein